MEDEGLRFNEGKLRYDLLPRFALKQVAAVLTKGAEKYAERNWERGMRWSKVIASMSRHQADFESGEDFDPEDGMYHAAKIATNALFLVEYYKTHPEKDDRPHKFLNPKKIGLDVDDVIADLIGALRQRFPEMKQPGHWNDYGFSECFPKILQDEDFWMNVPPKCELLFEPHCYITARSIDPQITTAWLKKYRFPEAPVYSLPRGANKADAVKDSGVDIFVDDSYSNFLDINRAGAFCYLFDALHNRKYNVGHRRIISLDELV